MTSSDRPRIGFVIHRFGEEVAGGVELYCRLLAERMSRHWEIEVITTCARDYSTWRDEFPAGKSKHGDVMVHRFPVDQKRQPADFEKLTNQVLESSSQEEQVAWMRAQGPYSSSLLSYLETASADFDLFFLFSYIYATTYFAGRILPGKYVLIPAAHDEPMLRLEIYKDVFSNALYLLYLTVEERRLIRRRMGQDFPGEVCGVGLSPLRCEAGFEKPERPYLIYVGRVDHPKGCGDLFSYFEHPPLRLPDVDLVVVGPIAMEIPDNPRIHAYGYLSEERKNALLQGALALVMPSPFESLSLVLLESWQLGVPVIANERNEVLRGHCLRSGGGLLYGDVISFAECALSVLSSQFLRMKLGALGHRYVQNVYNWENTERAFMNALDQASAS
ncbi:MAG: glycosyltransferase family 4 protein [Acidobacteriota bacterium]